MNVVAFTQMEREALLARWVQRSSDSEEDRMARAERMIQNAIDAHPPFEGFRSTFRIYTKGSYANDTNVRLDSDVDVVVENQGAYFHDYHESVTDPAPDPSFSSYEGPWARDEWRAEVSKAITNYFGTSEVDTSGEVAITVAEKVGSRPSADVVPAYLYYRYDDPHRHYKHPGSKVFKKSGGAIVNYPQQQLDNGNAKDRRTSGRYKEFVRVLKNAENALVKEGLIDDLPSYFMECLVYNVPDSVLKEGWTRDPGFEATLRWLYAHLHDEYTYEEWCEPNQLKYLFASQKWSRSDAQKLVLNTWVFMGYGDG